MNTTATLLTFSMLLGMHCFSSAQTVQQRIPSPQEFLKLQTPELKEDTLQVLATLPKQQFAGGEDIKLNISLKNVGKENFSSRYGNTVVDAFFDIKVIQIVGDTQREIAFLPIDHRVIQGPETSSWTIAPNKSRKGVVWLNHLFDFKIGGKFQVIASKKFRRQNQIITLKSEPLDFEIVTDIPISRWESYNAD